LLEPPAHERRPPRHPEGGERQRLRSQPRKPKQRIGDATGCLHHLCARVRAPGRGELVAPATRHDVDLPTLLRQVARQRAPAGRRPPRLVDRAVADEEEAAHGPNLITVTETLQIPTRPARLRTDVFVTLGGKGLSLLFGLAIVVLIARELGPTRQAFFAVAFSLTVILIHLGGLGLTTANPYFGAREPESRAQIVTNSLWLAVALGVVLVAIGAGLKLVAPSTVSGIGWTPLLIALAGVPAALAALLLQ